MLSLILIVIYFRWNQAKEIPSFFNKKMRERSIKETVRMIYIPLPSNLLYPRKFSSLWGFSRLLLKPLSVETFGGSIDPWIFVNLSTKLHRPIVKSVTIRGQPLCKTCIYIYIYIEEGLVQFPSQGTGGEKRVPERERKDATGRNPDPRQSAPARPSNAASKLRQSSVPISRE